MGAREDIDLAVAQVATDYGEQYVKDVKAALSRLDKVVTGALYNSIDYNVVIQENGVHLQLLYLDYLQWINKGRFPGKMPPVDAILAWVQARNVPFKANARRNVLGRFSKGFKFNPRAANGRFQSILKQQTSLAWAIAVSIKNKGIKPVPILDEANAKLYSPMQIAASNAAANAASVWLGEEIANQIRQTGLQIITTY